MSKWELAYDKLNKFLSNNLDITDYAEYSEALEAVLRAAQQPPADYKQCPGIPRDGCRYLAPCECVCDKCGEIHRAMHMPTQPPADIVLPPLPPIADVFTVAEADYVGSYANDHARAAVLMDRERRAIF